MTIDLEAFEGGLMAKVEAATVAKRKWLRSGALLIERQAKLNATGGRHAKGTPTTAVPGSGPAIVTGTLRRSIRSEFGLEEAKVGPTVVYGRSVELQYNYPYLIPAAQFAVRVALPVLLRTLFGEAMRA